jgi:hypothetical protein
MPFSTQLQLNRVLYIAAIACFTVFAVLPGLAQITTGTVIGQVRDQAGQPLPEAIVTIINAQNRNKRATRSNDSGNYVIPNLPPGSYHIIASKDGHLTQCISSFPVLFNKNNSVRYPPNFKLPKQSGTNPVCQALANNTATANRPADGLNKLKGLLAYVDFGNVSEPMVVSAAPNSGEEVRRLSFTLFPPAFSPSHPESSMRTSETQTVPGKQASDGSTAGGLVNSTDVARSSNFTANQIGALPLSAATYLRTFDDLALLVAGVAPPPFTPGVRGPGIGFGIGTAGQFSVNGMRARSNNFSVDGTDNNDPDVGVRRGGYVAQTSQSLGAIAEVSVSTLLWSAELGRNFGSQINAVSKYGGSSYHGQVEGLFTDSRLNARNFVDYKGGASGGENPFTRAQAGATFSGPLFSNRTQFFSSFEGGKTNASVEEHFSAPTQADRDRVTAPFTIRSSCSADSVCSEYSLPSQAPLSYYPGANNPTGPYGRNTYSKTLPADGEGLIASFRLTQRLTESHTLNGKYGFTEDSRVLPSINRAINSTINSASRSQNLSLILDSQIFSRGFNQARMSFGRTRIRFPEHQLGGFAVANFGSSDFRQSQTYGLDEPQTPTLPTVIGSFNQTVGEITVEPFSSLGVNAVLFPQGRINNNFQFADIVALQKSNHSLKVGGDVRRVQFNNFQDRLYRPQLHYGYGLKESGTLEVLRQPDHASLRLLPTARSAVSSIDLAMIFPSLTLQTLTAGTQDSHISLRLTESTFFLTDTWQLRPRVTVVYGMRYEYNSVPHDASRRIEDALELRNLPQPMTNIAPEALAKYESLINAYRRVVGNRKRMYDPDPNNFGPQMGFAWASGAEGHTAIRAGYGIYYDATLGAVVSQSRNLFPNQIPVGIDRPSAGSLIFPANCSTALCEKRGEFSTVLKTNQLIGGPNSFVANIATLVDQIKAGLAFSLPAKNLPTPYSQQWHLTIEREFGQRTVVSAGYIGSKGSKLTRISTPNLGAINTPLVQASSLRLFDQSGPIIAPVLLLDTASLILPARPSPEIGAYQIFENSAASSYHALQLEATRRYDPHLNFTLAYTWSHAIDDVSDIFPIAGAPVFAQNQNDLARDRGNANFDVRHRLTASVIWDVPSLKRFSGKAAGWLKDWQLASIIQAQTGQPFTLNLPIDANLDGNVSDRPTTTQGLVLNGGDRRQRISIAPGLTLDNFFVLGKDGNVGRNTLRGDTFVNMDLALTRTFRLAEQQRLQVRGEFFNLFNRANFGLPIRTLDAPGFGSAVETVNPARMIQFVLKYSF